MSRTWRVMISRTSELDTYPDPSFVQAAIDAVLAEQHLPVDMRYFRPSPDTASEVCAREVRGCDVYIAVLGHRYGSSFADRPDVSCTQFEFEEARKAGLPRLVFLLDPQAPVPMSFFDPLRGDRQAEFRDLARRGVVAQKFRTPDELARLIVAALAGMRDRGFDPADTTPARRAPYLVPAPGGDPIERKELSHRLSSILLGSGHGRKITALVGAGGLGKTTLAQMVCSSPAVRRRYPGGVLWLQLTQGLSGAQLAELINDLSYLVSGRRPQLSDPEQAALSLRDLLEDRPDTLLVADSLSSIDQIRPLLWVREPHRLLVTTRIRKVLPAEVELLPVTPMTAFEARMMLTKALPEVSDATIDRLLVGTGRWPLMLSIARAKVLSSTRFGASQEESGEDLADMLASSSTDLDSALDAVIRAGLETLEDNTWKVRFHELAVFPIDTDIPFDALELLWRTRGGLDQGMIKKLVEQLADCSLLERYRSDRRTIRLHSRVHERLRSDVGSESLINLSRQFLDAARALVPGDDAPTAWWNLPAQPEYLWRYLVDHLLDAGERAEARALCENFAWVEAKLMRLGAGAVESDITLLEDPDRVRLGSTTEPVTSQVTSAVRRVLAQSEPLLTVTDPPELVLDTLRSRLSTVPRLQGRVNRQQLQADHRPHLVNAWPPPDRPNPALQRQLRGHIGVVYDCAAMPGNRLVSCGEDKTVRIWNVSTGAVIAVLEGHTDWVRACAVASIGSWMASAGDDGEVRIWETDNTGGSLLHVLRGHRSGVRALAISPDGRRLVSGGEDGVLQVWDPSMAALHATILLSDNDVAVNCLAYSPDGALLCAGGDNGVLTIFDATTFTVVASLTATPPEPGRGPVYCCAFEPVGSVVVAGYGDGMLRRWHLDRKFEDQVLVQSDGGEIYGCVVDPAARWIAAGDRSGRVRVRRLSLDPHEIVLDGHTDWVQSCATPADGSWLASASRDGTLSIWDVPTSGLPLQLDGHAGAVNGCTFAPNSFWLASAGDDGAVRLWDTLSRATGGILETHTGALTSCLITPDGAAVITAGQDGVLRLWDSQHASIRRTFTGSTGSVDACALSRDGSWLVGVGADGAVRLWDVNGRLGMRVLANDGPPVVGCAFAPDDSWLATVGSDGEVRIWDWQSSMPLRTLTARTRYTGGCTVAPDGSWLAVGADDGSVWIWDTESGSIRTQLAGDGSPARGSAVSPDGAWLATAGDAGLIRVWSTARWRVAAQMRTAGPLADVSWSRRRNRLCAVGQHGVYLFRFDQPKG